MAGDLPFVHEMVEFHLNPLSFEKTTSGNISTLIISLILRWEYREWIPNADPSAAEPPLPEPILPGAGSHPWKHLPALQPPAPGGQLQPPPPQHCCWGRQSAADV